jgi:SAM-dependent methyltransferase
MFKRDNEWLKSILICPACKAPDITSNLQESSDFQYYQCNRCNRIYPVEKFGVINFEVVDKLLVLPEPYWGIWALAQNNSLQEYKMRSPGSIASPERDAVIPFSNFMDLDGLTVLDVGSGSDYIPAYLNNHSMKYYIALDPLPVEQEIPYSKVQAWAELMPFADQSFDAAILGTSLDHILCLESFWKELFRVLRNDGIVYIWGDFFTDQTFYKNVPQQQLFERLKEDILPVNEALAKFNTDVNSLETRFNDIRTLQENYGHYMVDQYHYRHIPINYFKNIKSYGFEIEDVEVLDVTSHIDYFHFMKTFLKLRKGKTASFEKKAYAKQHLDIMRQLAMLIEKVYSINQKTISLEYEINRTKYEVVSVKQEIGSYKQQDNEFQQLQQHDQQVQQQYNELNQQYQELKQHDQQVQQQYNELNQQYQELKQHDQQVQQQYNELNQQYQELKQHDQQVQHQYQELHQQYQELQKEILWLKAEKYRGKKFKLKKPFIYDDKKCWTAALPQFKEFADNEFIKVSPLTLFEDEKELGPGHALHDDIRNRGGGLYSHWLENIYFSTSDNTDPNENGRVYSVLVKIN